MSATGLVDPAWMRAQARVGRTLCGKWTLDRLLGVGGMAAVYAATHRNGKRVAVKMLHPELSAEPQIRERFLREGYVANKVGHTGAVSVSDDDVAEDGACFLVMDLLEGESLESRRERAGGRLDPVDVLSIMDQALETLAAAHVHGIVHRDLKPDNLFVTREGVVKVLDFGIARLREGSATKGTHTGISMGTPAFMAQEQARALWDEVDARTDLWAVGATMFTCLSGRVVHDGRTANEQLLSAMTKPAPSVRAIAPHVPRPVADVVDRALAMDRTARFQSAAEMQAAVRWAYEQMQASPISTAPKLVVPDVALHPTMASAAVLEGPTVRGVAAGTGAADRARGASRRRVLVIGVGAVAVAIMTAIGIALLDSRSVGVGSPPVAAEPPAIVVASASSSAAATAAEGSSSAAAAPAPSPAASVGADSAPPPRSRHGGTAKPAATKIDVATPPAAPDDPLETFRRKK